MFTNVLKSSIDLKVIWQALEVTDCKNKNKMHYKTSHSLSHSYNLVGKGLTYTSHPSISVTS